MNTAPIQQLLNNFHTGKLPSSEILQRISIYITDVLRTAVYPVHPTPTLTPAAALEVSSLHLLENSFQIIVLM